MRTEQWSWSQPGGWVQRSERLDGAAHLVLVFGGRAALETTRWYEETRRRWPGAQVVAASTAGEILGGDVTEDAIVATAIRFAKTRIRIARVNVREYMDSESAGQQLGRQIDAQGLAHVFVLSDGQNVNGSELVRGLVRHMPPHVAVTGGLAGDGARFERTYVCANGPATPGNVAAVAFYGRALRVGYGSLGGWDVTGDAMRVTRSRGNVVEQLDGAPALHVYSKLLGDDAEGLPASGLRYPLAVESDAGRIVVRTLLKVDAARGTLVFAGDIPLGSRVRLMRANFDRLVEGAGGAATMSRGALDGEGTQLALLISCVGRRLVLKERTVDEVAAVRKVVGSDVALTGFYSYGEICPSAPDASCELHNQTMTITTLAEEGA